jgi:hypothetical protein
VQAVDSPTGKSRGESDGGGSQRGCITSPPVFSQQTTIHQLHR